MMTMTAEERVDMLTEAQERLFEAIELIEGAVNGTGMAANVDAYLLATLRIAVSDAHGYLSSNQNVSDVIEAILHEDAED